MEGLAKSAFDSFNAFPIIQVAVAAAVFYAIWAAATRGSRDSASKPPELIPQWLMIGPLHDMMQSVHEVAEEARRTNDLLKDSNDILSDVLTEFRAARQTLEMIRNESRMR
jgi:hypothetical protein